MKSEKAKMRLIGAGILAAGILGMVAMVVLKADPPKIEPTVTSPLVVATPAERQSGPLRIRGNGSVQPVREIDLVTEVSGKLVATSDDFVGGGTFGKGQSLVRVDPSDYLNAVSMAEAEVTQAKYNVLTAEEEVTVAREEWERLKSRTDVTELPDSSELGILVLKEPQLASARANLASAEARLSDAKKRLERTNVVAPFNGIVRSKTVDLGQYVSPGQVVARVYSTDAVEIRVPLSSVSASMVEGLWSIDRSESRDRADATVTTVVGGRKYTYLGYVHRIEGAIDTSTRTIGVVVRVEGAYESEDGRPPLFVGTFATVELQGVTPETYYSIPSSALREDKIIWVVENGRLAILAVEVLQEVDDTTYVRGDFNGTPVVVTSALSVVIDGMEVRVEGER